jgi:hypothetical protein
MTASVNSTQMAMLDVHRSTKVSVECLHEKRLLKCPFVKIACPEADRVSGLRKIQIYVSRIFQPGAPSNLHRPASRQHAMSFIEASNKAISEVQVPISKSEMIQPASDPNEAPWYMETWAVSTGRCNTGLQFTRRRFRQLRLTTGVAGLPTIATALRSHLGELGANMDTRPAPAKLFGKLPTTRPFRR